ncbi:MAG: acyltransferase [Methylococcales bacterium]|nr:acyltransferase [Methylococcales bacterium]
MSINNLSQYRSELMGLAILWIMLFHSSITIPVSYTSLRAIKWTGYAGVDIFFLLSGIGISFSLSKSTSILIFYCKRVLRIIPLFWIFLLLILIKRLIASEITLNNINLLAPFFGIDFFIFGTLHYWFIPSILICYLFAPLYKQSLNDFNNGEILLIFTVITLTISFLIINTPLSHLLIFTIRLPVFALGLYIGNLLLADSKNTGYWFNNTAINSSIFTLSFAALIAVLLHPNFDYKSEIGLWWYPTIMMAFPASMLTAYLLKKCPTSILKILAYFGTYSLELYLIHTVVFDAVSHSPLRHLAWNMYRVPEFILSIIGSLIAAKLLSDLVNKINFSPFKVISNQ